MLCYRTRLLLRAKRDLIKIAKYMKNYNGDKIIRKIYDDIDKLAFMPRTHKTLIYFKDKYGEYRRIVSGKYVVIYKIIKDEIIILRIFSEKQNYLNSKNFILKEETQNYIINKRRKNNMIKFRTLKNSFLKLKENYTYKKTEEETLNRYIAKLIDEVESVPEEERVYYTHEEFWRMVEEMEIERYGHAI